jgi:hypothetical protein
MIRILSDVGLNKKLDQAIGLEIAWRAIGSIGLYHDSQQCFHLIDKLDLLKIEGFMCDGVDSSKVYHHHMGHRFLKLFVKGCLGIDLRFTRNDAEQLLHRHVDKVASMDTEFNLQMIFHRLA